MNEILDWLSTITAPFVHDLRTTVKGLVPVLILLFLLFAVMNGNGKGSKKAKKKGKTQ